MELVEQSVREQLTVYDYQGSGIPVLRGFEKKALEGDPDWEAKTIELAQYIDSFISAPN